MSLLAALHLRQVADAWFFWNPEEDWQALGNFQQSSSHHSRAFLLGEGPGKVKAQIRDGSVCNIWQKIPEDCFAASRAAFRLCANASRSSNQACSVSVLGTNGLISMDFRVDGSRATKVNSASSEACS